MRFLTNEEVREWCTAQGLKITSGRFLYYETESLCFSVGLEEKPSRVIALADYLVTTWEDVPFRGHSCGSGSGASGVSTPRRPGLGWSS
jgi:hypothetical protein